MRSKILEWIKLAQDRFHWQILVNTVMKFKTVLEWRQRCTFVYGRGSVRTCQDTPILYVVFGVFLQSLQ
jgi:hypothetical protein